MRIASSILECIGHTPLVEITGLKGQKAHLIAKLESFNPGGSVKDRTAYAMIKAAEQRGLLHPGSTIIEPTSGNTGVGMAWIGTVKGYKTILTMPDTMSEERRALLRAYGAKLVLTPGIEGMQGAINKAEELQKAIPGSIILGQFTNPANPLIHELTTGEEIWQDTNGEVDVFVAGVGTGGTLTGIAQALKKHKKEIHIVAVEPASSAVLSGSTKGEHGIQGIGAGFVPDIYDANQVNKVIAMTDEDAIEGARLLAHRYGILAGISSGAAFMAAAQLACLEKYQNQMIVCLLPDTGERYLSTHIFD